MQVRRRSVGLQSTESRGDIAKWISGGEKQVTK